jgi:hypothetical protein
VHSCSHIIVQVNSRSVLYTCTYVHSCTHKSVQGNSRSVLYTCTYILYYAYKADGAALTDVVFPAAENERRGYHNVQIEVMRYGAGTCRHLQKKNSHTLITPPATSTRSAKLYSCGIHVFLRRRSSGNQRTSYD